MHIHLASAHAPPATGPISRSISTGLGFGPAFGITGPHGAVRERRPRSAPRQTGGTGGSASADATASAAGESDWFESTVNVKIMFAIMSISAAITWSNMTQ